MTFLPDGNNPPAARFDLVTQPWIPVIRQGAALEVSLRQAVLDAHRIDALATTDGPLFTGLLRLLAALVMDAYGRPDTDQRWSEMRRHGRFGADVFDAYITRVGPSRFNLFDPDRPFLQSAATPVEGKTVAEILPPVAGGNTPPLFSPDTDKTPRRLTPAQAARSLVGYLPVAVPSPGRAPADESGQSWEGPSFAGRAAIIGFVAPIGASLFDTVLLNLPTGTNPPEDAPAWRRADPPPPGRYARPATGMLDLLTWTPRRVRLLPDEHGTVSHLAFRGGDALTVLDIDHEPHTALRVSDGKTAGAPPAGTVYPRKHLPHTLGWRGLPSLLAMRPTSAGERTAQLFADLGARQASYLPPDYRVTVAELLVEFGAMSAVYKDISFDSFPLPARAFGPDETDIRDELVELVARADQVRQAVRGFAWNVARAVLHDGSQDAPAARAYATATAQRLNADLDAATRRMLAGLSADPDRLEQAIAAWNQVTYRTALRYRDEIIRFAADRAFDGLAQIDDKTGRRTYRARPLPLSDRHFRAQLSALLPTAAAHDQTDQTSHSGHTGQTGAGDDGTRDHPDSAARAAEGRQTA